MASRSFPILFITAMDLPGAVTSSGLIKRLIDEVPDARFTIVAGPAAADLFKEVPGLDELIVHTQNGGSLYVMGLRRQLARQAWGLIVDTRGSGIADKLKRKRSAIHKPRPGEVVHPVIAAARLLNLEDDPPAPFLFAGPQHEAAADTLLPDDGRPVMAIAPGADWGGRVWPVERFAQVAARLLAPEGPLAGGRLLVFGPNDDETVGEASRFAILKPYVTGRAGTLGPLGDYALLKRCRLFIGNDGPWTHLAAAAGAPTLALFGPSDERTAAPFGPRARVVRGPRSFGAFKALDPNFDQAINHMMDLSIEAVMQAAGEHLAATEPAHG